MRWVVRLFAVVGLFVAGAIGFSGGATAKQSEETNRAREELQSRIDEARKSLGIERRTNSSVGRLRRLTQWLNWPNWNNWPNWGNWANW